MWNGYGTRRLLDFRQYTETNWNLNKNWMSVPGNKWKMKLYICHWVFMYLSLKACCSMDLSIYCRKSMTLRYPLNSHHNHANYALRTLRESSTINTCIPKMTTTMRKSVRNKCKRHAHIICELWLPPDVRIRRIKELSFREDILARLFWGVCFSKMYSPQRSGQRLQHMKQWL